MRTGVPGGGFVVGSTGSVSGVHGGGGMKTEFSGGGGGMRQNHDCVPHGAVAGGGAMRTGMAVRGRQHSGDGVSIANPNMDPEEFDGNFIVHVTISTYQIQNINF